MEEIPDTGKNTDPDLQATEIEPGADIGSAQGNLLSRIPIEIRARILVWLALTSARSFANAARSCHEFHDAAHTALFWEPICQARYSHASELVLQYQGWAAMFRQRPHMLFNGAFVAKCQYVRAGEASSGSWYAPWFRVTYWRYLRFFPDGRVRLLLSNEEPQNVFSALGSARAALKETEGRFSLNGDTGVLTIDAPGAVASLQYMLSLQVLSSGRKLHNKLKWIRYTYYKASTDQGGDFPLEHEGSFYFVRLKPGGL